MCDGVWSMIQALLRLGRLVRWWALMAARHSGGTCIAERARAASIDMMEGSEGQWETGQVCDGGSSVIQALLLIRVYFICCLIVRMVGFNYTAVVGVLTWLPSSARVAQRAQSAMKVIDWAR